MERTKASIWELKPNERNPRKISDTKLKKLVRSLLVFPRMMELRPIVVEEDGTVLGGNQRLKALTIIAEATEEEINNHLRECKEYTEKTLEEQVEIDNHWADWREAPEAYIIKADQLTEEEREAFIIKDNAPFGEWDWEALSTDWDMALLDDWGVEFPPIEELEEEQKAVKETERLSELEFTSMYYEPKEQPSLTLEQCVDDEKQRAKIKVIEESNLSEKQKEVMKLFSYRFLKINFEAVANYYAFCATEEEQKVMERLRLVLVDGGIDGFIEDELIRVREDVMATDEDWKEGGVSGYEK